MGGFRPTDAPPPSDMTGRGLPARESAEQTSQCLVCLAAQVCQVPIAFLAVFDEGADRLEAWLNLTDEMSAGALAFAHLAAEKPEGLSVSDATADNRFTGNPLLTGDEPLRFFAGVPLRNSEGRATGVLTVMDHEPRTLTSEQTDALRSLGRQAAEHRELQRRVAELDQLFRVERRAEEDLDRLFNLSLDMLCVAGFDGYFRLLNPAWEKTLGYTRDELRARPYIEFVHPDDRAATASTAAQISAGQRIIEFENRYLARDGTYRWLMWNAAPFAEEQMIYAAARDITDRKRTERRLGMQYATVRALAESASLAEAAPKILRGVGENLEWDFGALWSVDRDARALRLTDLWHSFRVNFPNFEAEWRAAKFSPGEGLPGRVWQSAQPAWIADITHDANFPRTHTAAKEGLCAAFAFPIQLGGEVLGVMEFFTRERRETDQALLETMGAIGSQIGQFIERQQAEAGLKRYAQELEQAKAGLEENAARLAALVKELEAAKRRAEDATRAKSEFLANVSHEIRTPLNAVMGMTELALETRLSAQQREHLSTVRRSAESLLDLLNDLLDFSKIEARKLELDHVEFSLRDVLEHATKVLAVRASEKHLELACHIHPEVPELLLGDPARLRQIITNLVSNAIKFTERGEVLASVETVSVAPGEIVLHFKVSDTGIGIAPEKQVRIFEAFAQADASTARKYGGTGLGLSISTELIKLMGGRIWLESEVGRGSTFHFTARFEAGRAPAAPAGALEPSSLHHLPVLVVDDSTINRRILDEMLTRWQMKPTLAESGRQALALLEMASRAGTPYRLALLDAHMPEMDGFALAAHIKRRRRLARTTLMMLTSAGQAGDVARCRRLGINAYLTKPVRQADLLDAIIRTVAPARGAAARHARAKRLQPVRRLRVLLAEDNPVNRQIVVHMLRHHGHSVKAVENGRQVLEMLAREAFDILLLDLEMPEMDGLETAAIIREREKVTGGHLPLVALTAHALEEERGECLTAGLDAYLAKPLHAEELFHTLEALASLRPAAKAEAAAKGPEPFDETELMERVGGKRKLLRELIGLFLTDSPARMHDVAHALHAGDAPALARAAHALRGSLGTFAARPAVETALALETLAQQGTVQGAAELFRRLQEEVARLFWALSRLQGAGGPSEPKQAHPARRRRPSKPHSRRR